MRPKNQLNFDKLVTLSILSRDQTLVHKKHDVNIQLQAQRGFAGESFMIVSHLQP